MVAVALIDSRTQRSVLTGMWSSPAWALAWPLLPCVGTSWAMLQPFCPTAFLPHHVSFASRHGTFLLTNNTRPVPEHYAVETQSCQKSILTPEFVLFFSPPTCTPFLWLSCWTAWLCLAFHAKQQKPNVCLPLVFLPQDEVQQKDKTRDRLCVLRSCKSFWPYKTVSPTKWK